MVPVLSRLHATLYTTNMRKQQVTVRPAAQDPCCCWYCLTVMPACTSPQQKFESLFCREKLVAQGRGNVDAVRHELEREQKVNEIKAVHLKAACWEITAVPEAKILPVGQTSMTSGLADYEPTDEMSTRFAAGTLAPVSNMPIRKLSEAEAERLQEVCTSHASTVQCVPLMAQQEIWLFRAYPQSFCSK